MLHAPCPVRAAATGRCPLGARRDARRWPLAALTLLLLIRGRRGARPPPALTARSPRRAPTGLSRPSRRRPPGPPRRPAPGRWAAAAAPPRVPARASVIPSAAADAPSGDPVGHAARRHAPTARPPRPGHPVPSPAPRRPPPPRRRPAPRPAPSARPARTGTVAGIRPRCTPPAGSAPGSPDQVQQVTGASAGSASRGAAAGQPARSSACTAGDAGDHLRPDLVDRLTRRRGEHVRRQRRDLLQPVGEDDVVPSGAARRPGHRARPRPGRARRPARGARLRNGRRSQRRPLGQRRDQPRRRRTRGAGRRDRARPAPRRRAGSTRCRRPARDQPGPATGHGEQDARRLRVRARRRAGEHGRADQPRPGRRGVDLVADRPARRERAAADRPPRRPGPRRPAVRGAAARASSSTGTGARALGRRRPQRRRARGARRRRSRRGRAGPGRARRRTARLTGCRRPGPASATPVAGAIDPGDQRAGQPEHAEHRPRPPPRGRCARTCSCSGTGSPRTSAASSRAARSGTRRPGHGWPARTGCPGRSATQGHRSRR